MEILDHVGPWAIPGLYVAHLVMFPIVVVAITVSIGALRMLGIGQVVENKQLRPNQVANEIKWGLPTLLVMSLYFHFSVLAIDHVFPFSAKSALLNILIFVVAHDFYVYVSHRALHSRFLWRYHRQHHLAVTATPWSSLSMHPVEALVNYLPFLLFAVFTSVSLAMFLGIYVYLLFGIVYSHSNYNAASESHSDLMRDLNTFHQHHHSSKNGNFGLLYTHWDSVFGTKLPR